MNTDLTRSLSSAHTPWTERRISVTHRKWFESLIELHQLTLDWLSELKIDRPSHFLSRKPDQKISEELRGLFGLLESFAVTPTTSEYLTALLDDTQPEDLLARLENLVHVVRAATLSGIREETPEKDWPDMRGLLQQIAWRAGRKSAQIRWSKSPSFDRQDLRQAFEALKLAPIFPFSMQKPILAQRALPDELRIELLLCPHRSPFAETRAIADDLCPIDGQWIRGFAYEINSAAQIQESETGGAPPVRCLQTWTLPKQ